MVAQSERVRLVPHAGVVAQEAVAARAEQQPLGRAFVRNTARITMVILEVLVEQFGEVLDLHVDVV